MELEADDASISVTVIKPSAIDTPHKEHAKNYLDDARESYAGLCAGDGTVAEAILYYASNPYSECLRGAREASFASSCRDRICGRARNRRTSVRNILGLCQGKVMKKPDRFGPALLDAMLSP